MRTITILIVMMIPIVATTSFGSGASHSKDDAFHPVPSSKRAQLKSRLDSFVAYHTTEEWDKVYDLLGNQYKTAQGLTKDSFIERKFYSHLIKFTPMSAENIKDGWWWILGCGTFKAVGSIDTLVEAYYENGNWYFSNFGRFPYGCIECAARDCKP